MHDANPGRYLSRNLAAAFLAGPWNESELVDRAGVALRPRPRWVRQLARQVLAAYHHPPTDRPRELARFIELQLDARPGLRPDQQVARVRGWLFAEPTMARMPWAVPEIASVRALAEFVGVSDEELAWFADVRGLERSAGSERLRHYRYVTRERRGRTARVIEQPKPRLKAIQRQILHEILDNVPAGRAAHGFTRGRSVRSHAAEHVGSYVVVRFDLEDFFASVSAGRAYGVFRTAGYPEAVAHALTGLVTNVVPGSFWHSLAHPADPAQIGAHHRLGRRLATPHLPQGAPTSPALANLAAFRLDRRLSGLARAFGAHYTRYADDLTFSGPVTLARGAAVLRRSVSEIAAGEGFRINDAKSTLTTRAGRQRVCGVVVNDHLNVPRGEYERLKAVIHNSITQGPASQNRGGVPDFRAHLLGRIAWVASLNPGHGAKLRAEFDRIEWSLPGSGPVG